MKLEKLTHGQQQAIRIITAQRLGIETSYTKVALEYLKTGILLPALSLHLEKEANKVVQEIISKKLENEAMNVARKICLEITNYENYKKDPISLVFSMTAVFFIVCGENDTFEVQTLAKFQGEKITKIIHKEGASNISIVTEKADIKLDTEKWNPLFNFDALYTIYEELERHKELITNF